MATTALTKTPLHVAAYGTLMSGQANPLAPEVRAALASLGPCRISGALYAIGPAFIFPGLLDQPAAAVRGELFRIEPARASAVLAALDAYEGFDADDPQGSAYIRRMVRLRQPALDAWLYVYNPAATGAQMIPIPSGDWTDFRATRRSPVSPSWLHRL